eukprot:403360160
MDLNLIYARGYVGYTLQQLFNYTQKDPSEKYYYMEMPAKSLSSCQLSPGQQYLGCFSGLQLQNIMKDFSSTVDIIFGISDTIMIINTINGEIYKNFLISSNNDFIGYILVWHLIPDQTDKGVLFSDANFNYDIQNTVKISKFKQFSSQI